MKKWLVSSALLLLFSLSFAETVKLKDGTFISGSIISQTEYTLNLSTSYGPVVLNQREVEAILPDKHRVHLKGGTELVGVIVDLDEFNLKLKTDEGVVNIDMPQILSVETYDYDQGNRSQEQIAQRQQAQAAALAANTAAVGATAGTSALTAAAAQTAAPAEGGLSFDADIEKVFDTKKPEIVNGQVQTVEEISAAEIRAQRAAAMTDEEAFLKGVSPQEREAAIAQTAAAARSGKLQKMQQDQAKKAARSKDKNADKYFAISVGAQGNNLKLDNTDRKGFEKTSPYEVGGTSVRAEATFMWCAGGSNFWFGPSLAIANIQNSSFPDLDPAVIEGNKKSKKDHGYLAYDEDVSTSGQLFDFMLKSNYYFNPDHLFAVYATAAAGYRMLTLNYRGGIEGDTIHANTFVGSAGLGVETHVDDLMIGLELSEFFSPYSKPFKDSSAANTVLTLKFSWKF